MLRLLPWWRRRDDELTERLFQESMLAMAERDMAAGWEALQLMDEWPAGRPMTTDAAAWK